MRFNKTTRVIVPLLPLIAALTFEVGYSSNLLMRPTGTIIGTVLDCNNARIPNAETSIDNELIKRRVNTNEDGEFKASLPAGVYRITVEANGFRQSVYSSVKIRPTATKRINIYLDVADPAGLVPASGSAN